MEHKKKIERIVRSAYDRHVKYNEDMDSDDRARVQSLFAQVIMKDKKLEYSTKYGISKYGIEVVSDVCEKADVDFPKRNRSV